MKKDYFSHKAHSYEQEENRVKNVENISNLIINNIHLRSDMDLMDFGSGTGLLLEKIAPYVNKITAVDISKSMNQQLKEKNIKCELEICEVDLTKEKLNTNFSGIISSMTLHHIEDTLAIFLKFHSLLCKNGFLAIADLQTEDGSFHTEDTGVFHFGFDRTELKRIAHSAGFKTVKVISAGSVNKPQGNYPVFLLIAYK